MRIVARKHLKRLTRNIHTDYVIPVGSKFPANQTSTAPQIQHRYGVSPVNENGLNYITHGIGMYGMRHKELVIK